MQLTKEEIKKFQDLMFKKYGKKLSRERAEESLTRLVLFIKAVIE